MWCLFCLHHTGLGLFRPLIKSKIKWVGGSPGHVQTASPYFSPTAASPISAQLQHHQFQPNWLTTLQDDQCRCLVSHDQGHSSWYPYTHQLWNKFIHKMWSQAQRFFSLFPVRFVLNHSIRIQIFPQEHLLLKMLLVGCLTFQQQASVSLDGSAQTILHAATLRQKTQIKLTTSSSHSILTPGQPVPALTLNARNLAGQPLECQFLSHWSASSKESTVKNLVATGIQTPDLPLPRRTPYPLGQQSSLSRWWSDLLSGPGGSGPPWGVRININLNCFNTIIKFQVKSAENFTTKKVVCCLRSQQHASVSQRQICSTVCAATL